VTAAEIQNGGMTCGETQGSGPPVVRKGPLLPAVEFYSGTSMNKKAIVLFAAEILAVALLRLTYMVRRDKLLIPKSSRVRTLNARPVYRQPHINPRRLENGLRDREIEGWTRGSERDNMDSTPDDSPGA